MSRLTKSLLAAALIVLASAGLSLAAARELGGGAVYHGCVNGTNGNLRVVDDGACRHGEHAIAWNETGPAGAQGLQGPQGPQGPQGDTGPQGPAGVVSLASLAGSACTRHDGSAGTVDVTVGSDDSISIVCAGGGDWCATNTPAVGPHVTVTCDSTTHELTYRCETGWGDANHDASDGCETPSPLAPIPFSPVALAQFTAANSLFGGVHTATAAPDCGGTFEAACPGGQPSSPLPTLSIDGSQRAGDLPRLVADPDTANSRIRMTARFRLRTVTPIPVTLPVGADGAACGLNVDTTEGPSEDMTVTFDDNVATAAPDGPTFVSDVTVSGLEAADYSLSGGFICALVNLPASSFLDVVQHAITPYVEQRGTLCGAPEPLYFQECP